jgi:hypothetical protein
LPRAWFSLMVLFAFLPMRGWEASGRSVCFFDVFCSVAFFFFVAPPPPPPPPPPPGFLFGVFIPPPPPPPYFFIFLVWGENCACAPLNVFVYVFRGGVWR